MISHDADLPIRLTAFAYLEAQVALHGDVVPKTVLDQGFDFQGQNVALMGPKGIFKPRAMDLPLSFTTVPPNMRKPRPYEDELGADGVIRYRYRGTDPQHPDNVGLRKCMGERLPLVYLFGVVPGQYMPVWPVYIVGDDPSALTFTVEVDSARSLPTAGNLLREAGGDARRRYITAETQQRLHQRSFRDRVLLAYRECCAMCRLRHKELLDASHIIADGEPMGDPIVPNGLALCKLHHAAFDRNFVGITPDYEIVVREDILEESDGPMLQHGLKEMHGKPLWVPRSADFKPSRERLDIRYEAFRKAG